MIENLGESGKLVLAYARRIAANLHAEKVGTEHLFLGVGDLEDAAIQTTLLEAGLDIQEACARIRKEAPSGMGTGAGELPLTEEAEHVFEVAKSLAARLGQSKVEAPHILCGVLEQTAGLTAEVLQGMGADPSAARGSIESMLEKGEGTSSSFYKTRRNVEQAGLGKTAELLEYLGRDLTQAAEEGKLNPIIGRDKEIGQVVKILLGKRKNNAALLGDAGVGKTAIVEGLAQRIVAHEVPGLDGMRIRTIEVGSLVAGTQYRGQFEERLKTLIDGVSQRTDIILFIDEMHTLIGAGTADKQVMGASDMLKTVLTEGSLKVIGATTTDEYRKYIERETALARRFQPVVVGEPSREATLAILTGLRPKYEEFHVVRISDEALEAAVDLSVRFVHDRSLPDKAIDLVDKACTQKKLDLGTARTEGGAGETPVVEAGDIANEVSLMLEIPIARVAGDEKKRLAGMADALKERVFGQDHAVEMISNAIVRARTGFGDPERPYGVFFFLGPTGVGKTKLAEEVAEFLFGDKEALVSLDMSQYFHAGGISELIGSAAGYVGWEEGGKLTNAVRDQPHSVVLLDEFEKADPAVWNLFLPIFDNGRIEDSLEREIDFRNTVIVMTSNVGSRRFEKTVEIGIHPPGKDEVEASFGALEDRVRDDLKEHFTPEFLNRPDEIIVFKPLSRESIRKIVRRRIDETALVELELTDGALEFLAERSYEPSMGARPVRRAIQRLVVNPLSQMMVRDEIAEGDTVNVGLSDGRLTFEKTDKGG